MGRGKSREDPFQETLGTRRGTRQASLLLKDTPQAQAEVSRLSESISEATDVLCQYALSGHQPAVYPLLDNLLNNLAQKAAFEYAAHIQKYADRMLVTLGISSIDDWTAAENGEIKDGFTVQEKQDLRDITAQEVKKAVKDALYRLQATKTGLLLGENKEDVLLRTAENEYRLKAFPRVTAERLHGKGLERLQKITGSQGKHLPSVAALEAIIVDSLDQNQHNAPVLDSLSDSGREYWLEYLAKAIA